MVSLAQLRRRCDAKRLHEVLHVEPVGAARAGALLLLQPDFFFGNIGELRDGRDPVAAGSVTIGKVVSSRMAAPVFLSSYPIDQCPRDNRIIT